MQCFWILSYVNTKNPIYQKDSLCIECTDAWKEIRHKPQEEVESKIQEYLTTLIPIQGFLQTNHSRPGLSQSLKSTRSQILQKPIEEIIVVDFNPPPNAAAQKKPWKLSTQPT